MDKKLTPDLFKVLKSICCEARSYCCANCGENISKPEPAASCDYCGCVNVKIDDSIFAIEIVNK